MFFGAAAAREAADARIAVPALDRHKEAS